MNKKNIIILVVAVALVLALGVFFISNMLGSSNLAKDPAPSNPGETSDAGSKSPNLPPGHVDISSITFGELAPDFTLKNLAGEEVKLSDYRGKIVFLNFWATWCMYCDEEMPDLQALNDENDDMVVLAVNVSEDPDKVRSYIEKGGYDFPILLDEEGEIALKYLVGPLPITYFINTKGILVSKYPSMLEKDQMEEALGNMRILED